MNPIGIPHRGERPISVLLIEDDEQYADMVRMSLQGRGDGDVQLSHAPLLSAGLERLRNGRVDVVLLDLTLPDGQGLETVRRVRASSPSACVVVLTGHDDDFQALQAVREGAQDYVVKHEARGGSLLRAIRHALERKRATDALQKAQEELEARVQARTAELAAANKALQAEIAERKLLMEQLQQSVERLQRADQMKDTFLAVVTHELRAPTQAILGFAELLQDGLPPEQAQEALTTIQYSALNQANLINNLLDFAKLDAGQLSVHPQPTDLARAVHDSIQVFRFATSQKQLRFETELPDGLPPVIADPERLRQILVNLVGNAVKFTDSGGWVRVSSGPGLPGEQQVAIADNGIGIAPEHRELIFQRFGQVAEAQSRNARGTGLGLAITRWLVEAQGGRIWVDSEPGKGSTFTFTLPTA